MNGAILPLAAVAAGMVSATSPCVLPVLPGYLAAVSAAGSSDADTATTRLPSVRGAVGFVMGFTIVFTLLGATASALGGVLFANLDMLLRLAGAALIVLGLHSLGWLRLGFIQRERRLVDMHGDAARRRPIVFGAIFGLGWTPCIGPVLATILTKAAADSSLLEGALLLLLYSAGLGVPFIGAAIWFDRSQRIRRWLGPKGVLLQRVGAATMILVGLAYLTGAWSTVFTGMQRWLARSGWPPI